MLQKNLKQKAISGMMWTTMQRFIGMGISFVSGIILARLLTPEDYGAIGMLSIFMVLAQTFLDSGFASALIQKKRPTPKDYSTVFWFNLIMSIFLYIILFLSAPLIADFYHMPVLCNVLRIQALVLIINALTIVQSNQLRKTFQFKKIALITLFASMISLIVTIWMAYNKYGVWALVVQGLLAYSIPSLFYWITNKWLPKMVFSISSFKELYGFGVYMFFSNLLNTLCNNIQGLLIGRLYSPAMMGYYSKARSTEELASTSISSVMGQVTYPLYAEYQDNKIALAGVIKKITSIVAFLTFPMMFLLIIMAKPIFILLYSEKWVQSVPYFQILCLAGIAICLQGVNFQAIAAIGKSKQMFSWTVVKRVIGLFFLLLGLFLGGINGLLIGMVLQSWLIYLINGYQVHKYVGYRLTSQIRDLLPILFMALVPFVIVQVTPFMIKSNIYLVAFVEFLLYTLIYCGGAFLFNLESFENVKDILPNLLGRGKN